MPKKIELLLMFSQLPSQRDYIQYNRGLRPDSIKENPKMIVIISQPTYTSCKMTSKIHSMAPMQFSFLWFFFSSSCIFSCKAFYDLQFPKILAKTMITILVIKISLNAILQQTNFIGESQKNSSSFMKQILTEEVSSDFEIVNTATSKNDSIS